MLAEMIPVKELMEEVTAMLNVCFEGQVVDLDGCIGLILKNGQRFCIRVEEV